ncbi:DUF6980 family protein [Streptomyces cavernae]|uniref:DUF6980 family protein n=1 Tax=Streptomyces cavernae TaxID=2259034 RepID=UPI0030B85876
MTSQVNRHCDLHPDPFGCPDALVVFSQRFQEYGLIIHDGGTATSGILFCPWCGARLPESQRDRWFDELEARGIDPSQDDIPAKYLDAGWLRS